MPATKAAMLAARKQLDATPKNGPSAFVLPTFGIEDPASSIIALYGHLTLESAPSLDAGIDDPASASAPPEYPTKAWLLDLVDRGSSVLEQSAMYRIGMDDCGFPGYFHAWRNASQAYTLTPTMQLERWLMAPHFVRRATEPGLTDIAYSLHLLARRGWMVVLPDSFLVNLPNTTAEEALTPPGYKGADSAVQQKRESVCRTLRPLIPRIPTACDDFLLATKQTKHPRQCCDVLPCRVHTAGSFSVTFSIALGGVTSVPDLIRLLEKRISAPINAIGVSSPSATSYAVGVSIMGVTGGRKVTWLGRETRQGHRNVTVGQLRDWACARAHNNRSCTQLYMLNLELKVGERHASATTSSDSRNRSPLDQPTEQLETGPFPGTGVATAASTRRSLNFDGSNAAFGTQLELAEHLKNGLTVALWAWREGRAILPRFNADSSHLNPI